MLRRLKAAVDELLRSERPGTPAQGDPARAIVTYSYGDDPEAGVRKDFWWRKIDLRLADGPPEGPVTRVEAYLVRRAHGALRTGLDVPVRVAPGTRTIVGLDVEAYEAEVAARDQAPT